MQLVIKTSTVFGRVHQNVAPAGSKSAISCDGVVVVVVTENVCRVDVDSSYVDADNCRGYVVCVAGQAFHFVCPTHLVFNAQRHFCDFDLHNTCPPLPSKCSTRYIQSLCTYSSTTHVKAFNNAETHIYFDMLWICSGFVIHTRNPQ